MAMQVGIECFVSDAHRSTSQNTWGAVSLERDFKMLISEVLDHPSRMKVYPGEAQPTIPPFTAGCASRGAFFLVVEADFITFIGARGASRLE